MPKATEIPLTVAAAEMKLGYWATRTLFLRGLLVGRRVGRRYFISRASLQALVRARKRAA